MKHTKKITKPLTYTIKLPGETVLVGPGTVPTSIGSVSQTSMKDMISKLREASRDGIFGSDESDTYATTSRAGK